MFARLNAERRAAPAGELGQFAALSIAQQYRLPYALTLAALRHPARVLDWGCGDGHFAAFLHGRGHDVTAYSLQHRPHVLREAPDPRLRYVQGDLSEPTRLPFPDASFDAVFSVGVLEHVRELGGTEADSLAEIRRVLAPSGLFLCFHLPNRFSGVEALARLLKTSPGPGHDAAHRYRYAGADVERLLAQAGFETLARGLYAFLPRNVFGRLPAAWRDSTAFAKTVNRLDDALAAALPSVCQNHFAVAAARGATSTRSAP
ncbi:MAG TPA: class I SAM-dependent methyltransferase [Thermoanaerobaculia bacterium]|nr:class I SAM-dependent methyltransferase [Thermoanaerobaculia bacterium]